MRTGEDAQADPLRGLVLDGRYRLEDQVARGGMATVYRAVDERLDRWVAVKVMHAAFADDPEFVARFTREARAAARLSSPEVVAVFDQGHDERAGLVYLVMELVLGKDLRALMRERGRLPADRALSLIEPVLTALAAAHAAGIVHRDVKPENVLLGDDGRIKVADFGLARAVEASTVTGTTGVLMGTVAYLAPEQIEHGTADPRTDVYAAGILLWEMLVGRAPVTGDTAVAVLYSHVNRDVLPPSTEVDGVPPALDNLVVRATRRDVTRRPQDAGAFLAEVRALRAQLPRSPALTQQLPRTAPAAAAPTRAVTTALPARRAADTAPQPRPRRRRRGLVAALVVLVLGLLAGVGGWWFGSGRYTSAPDVLRQTGSTAAETLQRAGFEVRYGDPEFDNSGSVPEGAVLDQDPDPRDRVVRGGTITLVLSSGRDLHAVPRLVGLTEAQASAALARAALGKGTVTTRFSDRPRGTVVETSQPQGQELLRGTRVDLVLSKGVEQLPVPTGLVGLLRGDAEARLREAGFSPDIREVFDEQAEAGSVVAVDPSTGRAPKGSVVRLDVSKGPEPRVIPDGIVGMRADQARDELEALDLQVQVLGFDGRGRVIDVRPGEGSEVERGSTVTLLVF